MVSYPRAEWRLLIDRPAPGAWNMAVDEAIVEQVNGGDSPPTLRLYGWEPPCLSLGYAQPSQEVDHRRLHQAGWDLVRRATGGRAILHADELTYAVIGPEQDPRLSGGILPSYRRLAQALLSALELLHLPAEVNGPADPAPSGQAGQPVSWERSAQALARGFETALNLSLLPGTLTEAERNRAESLSRTKYGDPAWTGRR